jgi:importin-5
MAHQQFLNVINGLLQPDNTIRKQAEAAYHQFVKSSAEQSAGLLLQLIGHQQAPGTVRQISAVLLRRLINSTEKTKALSPQLLSNIMQNSLAMIQSEQQKVVRRNICHLSAALAQSLVGGEGSLTQVWPALLPNTMQLAQNTDSNLQESGLFLLSILGEYCPTALRESAQPMFQALGQSFQNNGLSPESTSLLMKSTVCFLLALESENLTAGVPLMQPLMGKLSALLGAGEELAAREAMQGMVDMACDQGCAKFMGESMQSMVNAMVQIAGATSLDTETRIVALEFICTLGENRPGLIRKMSPQDVSSIVQLMINMACELDDAPQEWPSTVFQEMDDEESDDYVSGMALESLGRLGTKLGGRVVVPTAFQMIPTMLSHQDWRRRRAGILAIANIASGSKKMLKAELGNVFAMVLPCMQDQNQRVRFAATVAIGLLVQVFDDGLIQREFHANIVPALAQTLLPGSGSTPRVRAAAANTLITVFRPNESADGSDDADSDNTADIPVEQYLDVLLSGLVSILRESQNHHTIHEQAMDATAAIATSAGDGFARFYDSFMPAAKGIIMQASSEELRPLRGKTMQCIAKIGSAVGVSRFAADAQQIMQAMLNMQQSTGGFDEDVSMACAQICRAIGTHFAPYLAHCLPPLLSVLSKKNEFMVRNAEDIVDTEEEAKNGLASQVISMPGMEGKRITLNVNTVFEQQVALKCLYHYVDELGEDPSMAQYVEPIAKAVQPMVTNRFSPQSRTTSALLLPQVLHSCINQPNGQGLQVASGLLQFVLPCYLQQIKEEVNPEVFSSVSEGLCDIARYCYYSGGTNNLTNEPKAPTIVVPLEATRTIAVTLCKSISEAANHRIQLLNEAREENYDEEDMEDLLERLEIEHEDMETLIDAHGYLLKQHGHNFLPIFNELSSQTFGPLLQTANPPELRWAAVCAYDDVIEHCGPNAAAHLEYCMMPMLECSSSPNALLRQAAVYGLRIVAQKCPQQFQQFIAPVLGVMMTLMTATDAREGENNGPTENAICTLGVICTLFGGKHPNVNLDQILPHFVSHLPIKEDEECAQIAHEQLCSFVEQGQNGLRSCLPQVRNVFQQILVSATAGGGGGDDAVVLATPPVMNRIRTALQSLPQ